VLPDDVVRVLVSDARIERVELTAEATVLPSLRELIISP